MVRKLSKQLALLFFFFPWIRVCLWFGFTCRLSLPYWICIRIHHSSFLLCVCVRLFFSFNANTHKLMHQFLLRISSVSLLSLFRFSFIKVNISDGFLCSLVLFYQWNGALIREQIIDGAEWNAHHKIFLKHTNGKWKMAQSFAFMLFCVWTIRNGRFN